jgi:hypothetical protein
VVQKKSIAGLFSGLERLTGLPFKSFNIISPAAAVLVKPKVREINIADKNIAPFLKIRTKTS